MSLQAISRAASLLEDLRLGDTPKRLLESYLHIINMKNFERKKSAPI
jgi:hypothetical protein